jgi:hypothetical protein
MNENFGDALALELLLTHRLPPFVTTILMLLAERCALQA